MDRAKDVMSQDFISVPSNATVEEATRTLIDHEISGAPVVDEMKHLVGIISEYQLLEVVFAPQVKSRPVEEFMTKEVLSVDEEAPLTDVANLFVLHRVRRVPVLRDGKTIVGIVSRRDLLAQALKADSSVSATV